MQVMADRVPLTVTLRAPQAEVAGDLVFGESYKWKGERKNKCLRLPSP
jgi:hypothetical protein